MRNKNMALIVIMENEKCSEWGIYYEGSEIYGE